jgi:hypothetical protein
MFRSRLDIILGPDRSEHIAALLEAEDCRKPDEAIIFIRDAALFAKKCSSCLQAMPEKGLYHSVLLAGSNPCL